MRLLLIIAVIGGLLPLAFAYPHVGLLLWSWFTLMQPHREAWDLPPWLQLNLVVAVVTIAAWLVSREPKLPRAGALPVTIALLCFWMVLSQVYSLRPQYSWDYFDRDIRVMALIVLSLIILINRSRIHAMIWIIVISVGYYGVTGGLKTIFSGGASRIEGPLESMIADNNHLGVAIVTIIPLCVYLVRQSRSRLVRLGLVLTISLCVIAVIGTHSRGALIAFSVMCLVLLMRARAKFTGVFLVTLAGLLAVLLMPPEWTERMQTIETFNEDESFRGRVDAWMIAWDVAKARPLVGAGMRVPYLQDAVDPYLSQSRKARAAHSIFFEVLGSMGFVALGLFIGVIFVTFRDMRWLRRLDRSDQRLGWARDLGIMGEISLISFLVGGSSVSLEFWEGFWLLVALVHGARGTVEREYLGLPAKVRQPIEPTPATGSPGQV